MKLSDAIELQKKKVARAERALLTARAQLNALLALTQTPPSKRKRSK